MEDTPSLGAGSASLVGLFLLRIPVRSWVFPGNTSDVTTVTMIKDDLHGLRCVGSIDRLPHTAPRSMSKRHFSTPNLMLICHRRPIIMLDRDRGEPRDSAPPTPPGIRVSYQGGSIGLSESIGVKSG